MTVKIATDMKPSMLPNTAVGDLSLGFGAVKATSQRVRGHLAALLATTSFTTIQLRVFAHATMDATALELARSTATRLLDSAGIAIDWRNRGSGEDTCRQAAAANDVTVLLMPMTRLTRDDVGGEARHGGSTPAPMVLVYMPNLADRLHTVRQSAAARSSPSLASLQMGHLVGVAIAHEVGHCFGLPHARWGVMKAPIATDDLAALATSRLAFAPNDVRALRRLFITSDCGARRFGAHGATVYSRCRYRRVRSQRHGGGGGHTRSRSVDTIADAISSRNSTGS